MTKPGESTYMQLEELERRLRQSSWRLEWAQVWRTSRLRYLLRTVRHSS